MKKKVIVGYMRSDRPFKNILIWHKANDIKMAVFQWAVVKKKELFRNRKVRITIEEVKG